MILLASNHGSHKVTFYWVNPCRPKIIVWKHNFYFIFLPVKDNPKMKLYFSLFWLMFCNDNTRYLQNSKERKCLAQCWIGEVEWGLPMHGNKEVIIRRREKKKKKPSLGHRLFELHGQTVKLSSPGMTVFVRQPVP